MNILYLTFLDGKPWIGPTYSVPNQIKAQSEFDNVFWYNTCTYSIKEGIDNINNWKKLAYYGDLNLYPSLKISDLPDPFCKPDLIIVEQCYPFAKNGLLKEILKSKIPFIIVPRGEFTLSAQKKKPFKKFLGNLLLGVHAFSKKALAIQFLTENEKNETKAVWGASKIVIPNGVDKRNSGIKVFRKKPVFVFVGRFEPYQKGLDLLINGIEIAKKELAYYGASIHLYGSDFEGKRQYLEMLSENKGLSSIVFFHDAVFGNEKDSVLKNADVFVITSRFEGHPTGLLEALSYGLPCLVTTGSNMRKEIELYDAGWGSDNDANSISNSLVTALKELEMLQIKSSNALKLADLYSWNTIAKTAHDKYLQLLNKHKH